MTVARAAIGTFVLFYGAAEAIAGIATGTLVRYASDLPRTRRPRRPGPCRPSGTTFVTDDLLFLIGGIAWVVAVLAAAAAYRQAGAPLAACILLALSVIAVFHAPPTGPIGLLFLAGAVVLLARSRRARATTRRSPAIS